MTHFESLPPKQRAELEKQAVPGRRSSLAAIPFRGPGGGVDAPEEAPRTRTGSKETAARTETNASDEAVVHRAGKRRGAVVAGLSLPSVVTNGTDDTDDEKTELEPMKHGFGGVRRWSYDPEAEERARLNAVKDPVKTHEAVVPLPVKELDYWKAMEFFTVYDSANKGELTAKQFHNFMSAACRDRIVITREHSDSLFKEIDVDEGGSIDKEEFLGWVFQTNNNYLGEVRKRLESMEPQKVKKLFEEIDTNFNNLIDKDEFWVFVDKFSPTKMSREASDELHEFIDADHSGEIDLDEFLNWVHPSRELQLMQTGKDVGEKTTSYESLALNTAKRGSVGRRASVPSGFAAVDNADQWEAPKKPLMEVQRGKPVILEFTAGNDFEFQFAAIKKDLKALFGEQIKCEAYRDTMAVAACTQLEAKVGRGIMLWDRGTMLAYQEDPFESVNSARNWIRNVLVKCLPDVLQAANLRHYKRMKMNICYECGKDLGKRSLKYEEYKVCSATCRMALKNRIPPSGEAGGA